MSSSTDPRGLPGQLVLQIHFVRSANRKLGKDEVAYIDLQLNKDAVKTVKSDTRKGNNIIFNEQVVFNLSSEDDEVKIEFKIGEKVIASSSISLYYLFDNALTSWIKLSDAVHVKTTVKYASRKVLDSLDVSGFSDCSISAHRPTSVVAADEKDQLTRTESKKDLAATSVDEIVWGSAERAGEMIGSWRVNSVVLTDPLPNNSLRSSDVMFPDTERATKLDDVIKIGDVPFHRRRETFAVCLFFMLPWLSLLLSFFLIRTGGWLLTLFLVYIGYMVFIQDFHYKGGLPSKLVRKLPTFTWFRNFFPIKMHKSCELPPARNYIIGYHPHGIISLGALTNFATEATHFSEMFPGIFNRLMTLKANFFIPFYGLGLALMGVCDASKESIEYVMNNGPGQAVTLVLGGAKESLEARPGVATLFLKNRKGFVKIGLKHGASLLPCYSFGENDLYDQSDNPKGSKLRNIQDKLQEMLGFALPIVKGRGIFNHKYGVLPQRRPVNTVVGQPIHLPKVPSQHLTPQIIDEWHELYLQKLVDLYNAHKDQFEPNRRQSISIE